MYPTMRIAIRYSNDQITFFKFKTFWLQEDYLNTISFYQHLFTKNNLS
jgi:hypothetical protein